jgi:hypothetical protein
MVSIVLSLYLQKVTIEIIQKNVWQDRIIDEKDEQQIERNQRESKSITVHQEKAGQVKGSQARPEQNKMKWNETKH